MSRCFVFLKDELARWGIQADFLQISPYKTAADTLTRSEMSSEMRKMMDWILDSLYDQLLHAVATSRSCDRTQAQALIDGSPYTDEEALQARAVDAIIREEELPKHLALGGKPAERERSTLPHS